MFRQPARGIFGWMRAGLIAGALLATLAIAEPAVAQAPVPCSSAGGGRYNCEWFRAGDGRTGGAIVAVGTATVGYLHQGTNWIVCQQRGGDVYNSRGYRNYWFGWTTADNGRQGWASAVDARGGDDYGQFGGGVPSCGGAHGTPPSYNGEWGKPPASSPGGPVPQPGTPVVDADQDGVPAGTDCDDFNNLIYPGAPELVGDGHDQDCNGADAAGKVSAIVAYRGNSSRRWTRFKSLKVTDAPPGASVHVTCKGKRKRCPKSRTFTTNSRGSVSLTKMFRGKRIRVGASIYVAVSTPNAIGKVRRLRIARKDVKGSNLCLPPGTLNPKKC
jgi:hypothetical protein